MAKIIIHFDKQDHNALNELAEREYRTIQAQAALIIHRQLQILGLLLRNEPISESLLTESEKRLTNGT